MVWGVCVVMGMSLMILFLILLIYDDKKDFMIILSQHSGLASTISRPQLWQCIKVDLCKFSIQAKGVWEVWDRVAEVWDKIEPEEVQKLVECMPRRVAAVIKAKGSHTMY